VSNELWRRNKIRTPVIKTPKRAGHPRQHPTNYKVISLPNSSVGVPDVLAKGTVVTKLYKFTGEIERYIMFIHKDAEAITANAIRNP
jgi:hypothetical protein